MMKKSLFPLILFSTTVLFAYSGNDSKENGTGVLNQTGDTINMNDIVITATRTPKMLKDVPQLTRVISRRDIEAMGDVRIEDILQTEFAGAEFHQAGYGTSMSFQGLDARYVLFLIDGERMAGETYGNIDFSKIATNNIERIEIVKGASSVLYGSNAMGAIVNIITRNPRKKAEISVSGQYGGYNNRDYDKHNDKYSRKMDTPNSNASLYAGFNTGRFSAVTDASFQSFDAYKMMSTKDAERHYIKNLMTGKPMDEIVMANEGGLSISGYQALNISQRFSYKFSDKVSASIKGGYYWKNRYDFDESEDGRINPTTAVLPSGISGTENPVWNYENNYGYNFSAQVNYKINDKNQIGFSLFSDTYFRREKDITGNVTPKQRHSYFIPRVQWINTPNKSNRITVGMELLQEKLKYDRTETGYDTQYSFNSFAIYGQDEIQITERFSAVGGLRIENYGFDDFVSFYENFVGKPKARIGDGLSVTPKAALTYNFDRFTLRANYSMGFRNPSLKEKYMVLQPISFITIKGNPNLDPEKNHYVSLSGEYTSQSNVFNTSLNVYASFFRDKIDVFQVGQELIYGNIQKSKIYGLEWTGQVRIIRGWWLRGNYSYVHQTNEGASEATQYIFTSPHTATLQTNYSVVLKNYTLGFNLSGRYIGKKTYEDTSYPSATNRIFGTYEVTLPAYTMWDLSANITFKKHITLTAGAINLFNYKPSIVSFNSAITPGITGFVQLTLNL
ncbi:MAG TPA: TonB-dependent receptor [Candidatus Avirikenella pullistercoris]|nr:TonB-dependent receptor [Candidatus Avirikenella pullistercoris]